MKPAGALAGKGIVVTRPSAQAAGLSAAIEREGGVALRFPALEICELEDLQPLLRILERLESFDLAIFVSPNAVREALDLVRRRCAAGWPPRLRVAAIGSGSRRELEQRGFTGVIAPSANADSEALLALPQLASPAGAKVVIFRGEGGREVLGDTLAGRGASVEYAECYRRARPQTDCAPLMSAWACGAVHAVTVSSAAGLVNFLDMIGEPGQQQLRRTPLFVPHQRVAAEAARLAAGTVRIAGPGDAEMVGALVAYFRDAT